MKFNTQAPAVYLVEHHSTGQFITGTTFPLGYEVFVWGDRENAQELSYDAATRRAGLVRGRVIPAHPIDCSMSQHALTSS